jgi:hypothetical protein
MTCFYIVSVLNKPQIIIHYHHAFKEVEEQLHIPPLEQRV